MVRSLVVVDAEIGDRPGQAVRIEGDEIVAVGDVATVDRRGADLLDGCGGALLPGLHDHHLHLLALAARMGSTDLGSSTTPAEADRVLHAAAGVGSVDPVGWIRVAGYDEHRHGPLDRHRLDRLVGRRSVRVQHRSGLAWVVSTAGLAALGLDVGPGAGAGRDDPAPDLRPTTPCVEGDAPPVAANGVERHPDGAATGWLLRIDRWLGDRIGRVAPDLAPVGGQLAAWGITGVTDTTPVLDDGAIELLCQARSDGSLPQQLMVLGRPDGTGLDGWAELGPVKLVADEQVGLDIDALTTAVADAHRRRRPVAVHCVTRAECVAAVTALAEAGIHPGDRLEHGSVLPRELDAILTRGAVTVVAQPSFVAERGDHYLGVVDPRDRPDLHRLASLRRAGVPLAFGSDAPVATADPWAAMRAAQQRRAPSGRVIGGDEALSPDESLRGFLGSPQDPGGPRRGVAVGARADLCLLRFPRAAAIADPTAEVVRATIIGGRLVHG
jgi:predicted amidohydrolase YtcJ